MTTGPSPAVLGERRVAGAGLVLVRLVPTAEAARAYRAPGQLVEVRAADGASGYFALAGDVGASSWELLVRRNGGASDVLLDAPAGVRLQVFGPLGDGFPMARANGRPLVVAVTGSALAVARPVLRHRIASGQAGSTGLYLGARTVHDVALVEEVVGWVHAGVRVVLCLSKSEPGAGEAGALLAGARRARGYVQNVLLNDAIEGAAVGQLVFAAGPDGMLEALRRGGAGGKTAALEVVANV